MHIYSAIRPIYVNWTYFQVCVYRISVIFISLMYVRHMHEATQSNVCFLSLELHCPYPSGWKVG